MKASISTLRASIDVVTQLLAERSIKVTQKGLDAHVELDPNGRPKSINIPYLPDNAPDSLVKAIQGFVDHEVGHVLDTDFAELAAARTEWAQLSKGGEVEISRLLHIHGILEDIFVERRQARRFRGALSNMSSAGEFYLEEITKPALARGDIEGEARYLSQLMYVILRAAGGQALFQDFVKEYKVETLCPIFYSKVVSEVQGDLLRMDSTADTRAVARKIHSILTELSKPQTPPPPKQGKQDKKERDRSPKNQQNQEQDEEREEDEGQGDQDQGGEGNQEDGGDEGQEQDDQDGQGGPTSDQEDDGDDQEDSDGEDQGSNDQNKQDDGDDTQEEDQKDGGDGEGIGGEDQDDQGEQDEGQGDQGQGGDDGSQEDESSPGAEEGNQGQSDTDGESDEGAGGEANTGGSEGEDDGTRLDLASAFDGVPDYDQALADALGDASRASVKPGEYIVFSTEDDTHEVWNPKQSYSDRLSYFSENVDGMVGTMARTLERTMKAKALARWAPGYRNGRLDQRQVASIALSGRHPQLHNDKVFCQREQAITNDVAVMVLVDLSGSMSGSRIVTALQSAYGIAATLERIGVSCEVTGFTTTGDRRCKVFDEYQDAMYKGGRGSELGRCDPLRMPILKTFGERLTPNVAERFVGYIHEGEKGNTIIGEAIRIAYDRLVTQPKNGKVMLVLTDGEPGAVGYVDYRGHAKEVVEYIENETPVEIFGIGVQYDVSWLFRKYANLENISKLPELLMNHLTTSVLSKIHR